VDFEALGLDEPAHRLARAFVQLGGHQPLRAVNDDGVGAKLFRAGGRFEAQQAATDGDGVDLPAELLGEFGNLLVDGPDVFERAVDVGELVAGDGQAGGVRAGGHHQFVIRVGVAGGSLHGLRGGVDLHNALAGLQLQRRVVPHGSGSQGQVHAGIGEGLGQRDAVVGEVCFLGEDRDMPAIEATGMHRVRKTVGRGAAAGDDNAARCLGV
jgi:hypothetical protein